MIKKKSSHIIKIEFEKLHTSWATSSNLGNNRNYTWRAIFRPYSLYEAVRYSLEYVPPNLLFF